MTAIAVVTGNPKPQSRTHAVAKAVADVLAAELGGDISRLEIDLAEHAASLFDWSDPVLTRLTEEVAGADVAIFASPTYKAAYTGMLKAFLDRYGSNGLAGVVAVPVMTGGWPGHLLAVEVHLRPVLVELAATVPSRGLYVTEPELADLNAAVAKWSIAATPLITPTHPLTPMAVCPHRQPDASTPEPDKQRPEPRRQLAPPRPSPARRPASCLITARSRPSAIMVDHWGPSGVPTDPLSSGPARTTP